jgi:phage shock protein C
MTAETDGGQLPPPAQATPADGSASGAAERRLYRSRTNRMLAGVCGGIAETYGSDPSAVRLLTVVLGILTGIVPFLVLYLLAAVIVPERPAGEVAPPTTGEGTAIPGRGALFVGVVLILVGIAALGNEAFNVDWDVLWPVLLIVFGGALVAVARR